MNTSMIKIVLITLFTLVSCQENVKFTKEETVEIADPKIISNKKAALLLTRQSTEPELINSLGKIKNFHTLDFSWGEFWTDIPKTFDLSSKSSRVRKLYLSLSNKLEDTDDIYLYQRFLVYEIENSSKLLQNEITSELVNSAINMAKRYPGLINERAIRSILNAIAKSLGKQIDNKYVLLNSYMLLLNSLEKYTNLDTKLMLKTISLYGAKELFSDLKDIYLGSKSTMGLERRLKLPLSILNRVFSEIKTSADFKDALSLSGYRFMTFKLGKTPKVISTFTKEEQEEIVGLLIVEFLSRKMNSDNVS